MRHPVSLRKTRQAVASTIGDIGKQGDILNQHAKLLDEHSAALRSVGALLTRPFLGRLTWLLSGK